MALPSSITASGASGSGSKVAGLNGTYDLASGTDGGGNRYYTKEGGGYYAYFVPPDGNHWWFSDTLDSTGNGYYKVGAADSVPTGSGWTPAGNPASWAGGGLTVGTAAPAAPAAPTFGSVWIDALQVNVPALSGGATFYDLQCYEAGASSGFSWQPVQTGITAATTVKAFVQGQFRLVANNSAGSTPGATGTQSFGSLPPGITPGAGTVAQSSSASTLTATLSLIAGNGINTPAIATAPTGSGGVTAAYTGGGVSGGTFPYTPTNGTTQTIPVTITVPANTVPGTYTLTFGVTNDGVAWPGTAQYTVTVTAPPPPPIPLVEARAWTNAAGDTVYVEMAAPLHLGDTKTLRYDLASTNPAPTTLTFTAAPGITGVFSANGVTPPATVTLTLTVGESTPLGVSWVTLNTVDTNGEAGSTSKAFNIVG